MPYELFLALRYLRLRRGRRGAAQVTAAAALVGISCGVAALIVAMALANGFRDELQSKILRGTAHLTVMRADNQPLADARATVEMLNRIEGVGEASATTYAGALLSGEGGSAYTILRGVDRRSPRALAELESTFTAGTLESLFARPEPPEGQREQSPPEKEPGGLKAIEFAGEGAPVSVAIGAELGARTGLDQLGDEGWLVLGEKIDAPPYLSPRVQRVRVAALFRSGLYEYDSSWIYLPLDEAGAMRGTGERASLVGVSVEELDETEEVAARVRRALGDGWTTVDWREANRPLFAALELERRTVALIIGLIMLVAALNITATLVIVVVERRSDIAVLSAMGASPRSIMTIFVLKGAIIGALGAAAGVGLGLGACLAANHFGLVRLPPDVYSLSVVPLRPDARGVWLVALAAFSLSLLATLYPARTASRLRPASVLRYE